MCYNCGCLLPDDDMGSVDNITNSTLDHIAKEENKTRQQVMLELATILESNQEITNPHFIEMFEKASKAWGQPIPEAKKNTLDLLKDQLSNK
jgi:hypothetical protein